MKNLNRMLNERKTLRKLHEAFPKLSLDDLFKILDCYVETFQIESPHYWVEGVKTRPLNTITYDRTISQPDITTSTTRAPKFAERTAN